MGHMPSTLDFAAAAALPLTTITAWELLFERLSVPIGKKATGDHLLIIGAAGGVGSILTQLARRLTSLNVIGTASRPETTAWVKELGAHHVLDHRQPLAAALARIGVPAVEYVASLTHTDSYLEQIRDVLAPQGKFGLIDNVKNLDLSMFMAKSISIHWELMFTRSLFGTRDIAEQHALLTEAGKLVDAGVLRTTLTESLGTIDAANLRRAHALIESGKARGKLVLARWA